MSDRRYSFDTNILFYSVDHNDAARQKRAASLLARAARELDCVIPLQAFCEFYHAATRKGHLKHEIASSLVETWQDLYPTAYPSAKTFRNATAAVRDHNLSFWDAMLWAVVNEAGVNVLFSEDLQHGHQLGTVRFWNPFLDEDPFLASRST